MDVFSPYLEQAEGVSPNIVFEEPINWKPKNYLMIAEALNQNVWKDTLNDWEIYSMVFLTDCQENQSGFEQSHMIYFKAVSNDNGVKTCYARILY